MQAPPESERAALPDGPEIANLSIINVEYADAPLAGQVRKLREAFALREDTAVTVATLAFGGLQR